MRTFAQKPKATQQATSAESMIPGRAHFGQSPEVNSILHLQRTIGNQAVQRLLEANSEDVKEHDSSSTEIARFGHDFSRASVHAPASMPPIVHDVLASPGQPLDAATRADMEPRFGHNFGGVRIHADSEAAASAALVHARAYTVGQHIVLGAGQPSPESLEAQLLLAHELTHVVQQSGGGGGPAPELSPSAPHERDARAAAVAVATGLPRVQVAQSTGVGLACENGNGRLPSSRPFET